MGFQSPQRLVARGTPSTGPGNPNGYNLGEWIRINIAFKWTRPASKKLGGPEKYQSLTSDERELRLLGPKTPDNKNTNHSCIKRTSS